MTSYAASLFLGEALPSLLASRMCTAAAILLLLLPLPLHLNLTLHPAFPQFRPLQTSLPDLRQHQGNQPHPLPPRHICAFTHLVQSPTTSQIISHGGYSECCSHGATSPSLTIPARHSGHTSTALGEAWHGTEHQALPYTAPVTPSQTQPLLPSPHAAIELPPQSAESGARTTHHSRPSRTHLGTMVQALTECSR